MVVDSRHVTASLRFKDAADETIKFMHRVRPNITGSEVETLKDGINEISSLFIESTSITITEELVEVV